MKGLKDAIVAGVVLESTMFAFDKPYDYLIPENMKVSAGCRVTVPFGNANRLRQGLVVYIKPCSDASFKKISSVIDDEPILTEEMLKLCIWLHDTVFCTYFDAVRTVLPVGVNLKSNESYQIGEITEKLGETQQGIIDLIRNRPSITKNEIFSIIPNCASALNSLVRMGAVVIENSLSRQVGEATRKFVRLTVSPDELNLTKLTERQQDVLNLVSDIGEISVKEIQYFTGASLSVVTALEKKGLIETFDKDVYRTPYHFSDVMVREDIVLTEEQETAYQNISSSYTDEKKKPWLLYGITGSGKTQVFLKLVDNVVDNGKGAIIMVPEISLTPQTIQIFGNRYGGKVAVFHSAMSLGQRMDEWRRVNSGEACVAIGTRSAIFAPVKNLGLIVMDEEQEHSYKSESSPRFHARDVAKFRAAYNNATFVMASATPSIESFAAAKAGHYNMCTLKNRYGNAVLPEVVTIDMRNQIFNGNNSNISEELKSALTETLENSNQAILLLNRRGHNTFVSCPTCGDVVTCPNCSISMTYHSANNRLMCHYCGHSVPVDNKCPKCGGQHLKYMGVGTQKVEEELKELFPNAKILRLDADTTVARNSFDEKLAAFSRGEYNILLGTQMVAKGLNFPKVTLVGVLGIDGAMYSEDFRSFERAFSLLTQVVGRAGRGENPGKAIVQTIHPDGNLIKLASKQDYDAFYEEEILTRKLMIYPPYCDITIVCASATYKDDAKGAINDVYEKIREQLTGEFSDIKLIILGPAPASMPKINNRYRYRMIIKSKNNSKFRQLLRKAIDIKKNNDVSVFVDVNPESIF